MTMRHFMTDYYYIAIILGMLGYIVYKEIMFNLKEKDWLNRLMSKDYLEYKSLEPQKEEPEPPEDIRTEDQKVKDFINKRGKNAYLQYLSDSSYGRL